MKYDAKCPVEFICGKDEKNGQYSRIENLYQEIANHDTLSAQNVNIIPIYDASHNS